MSLLAVSRTNFPVLCAALLANDSAAGDEQLRQPNNNKGSHGWGLMRGVKAGKLLA